MIRHVFIFFATFAVGAVVALATRTALHEPHQEVTAMAAAEHAPMVNNALTPPASTTSNHVEHEAQAAKSGTASDNTPVNEVCAICGMKVDPDLPTAEYQGKTIGFGCKMCRPKFEANPDKYGPAYLRGEVLKK